ncbi:hypothetical protein KKA14_17030, partial [bacterium]|nr:hypothetical protein [bacterium]
IKINYPDRKLENLEVCIKKNIEEQLKRIDLVSGETVGVAVGSRGIKNISEIVGHVCRELKENGACPVIIPAMGSHGGATPAGQISVLNGLGVTEDTCGCGIVSSMESKQLGMVFDEVPVYYSSDALSLDHVICINRIKPHTKFKAPIESGVLKMLCLGLGKHDGALVYHKWALKYGFFPLLKEIAGEVIKKSNFRFGIGIIENAYDETLLIEGINSEDLFRQEERLLSIAKENMPRLPVSNADVLVIQEIGKDISGAGMDPNITGRASDLMEDDFSSIFQTSRLAILNLSDASNGNGLGIGNADIITEKVFQALDYEMTLMNVLTGMSLKKAAIPIRMKNDEKAIQACFTTIGPIPADQVRAIIIKNTLDVSECWVSQALYNEVLSDKMIDIVSEVKLEFDKNGELLLV